VSSSLYPLFGEPPWPVCGYDGTTNMQYLHHRKCNYRGFQVCQPVNPYRLDTKPGRVSLVGPRVMATTPIQCTCTSRPEQYQHIDGSALISASILSGLFSQQVSLALKDENSPVLLPCVISFWPMVTPLPRVRLGRPTPRYRLVLRVLEGEN
jgi:hypothetical protein